MRSGICGIFGAFLPSISSRRTRHRLDFDEEPDCVEDLTMESLPVDSEAVAICRSMELLIFEDKDFCKVACLTAAAFFGGMVR